MMQQQQQLQVVVVSVRNSTARGSQRVRASRCKSAPTFLPSPGFVSCRVGINRRWLLWLMCCSAYLLSRKRDERESFGYSNE